MLLIFILALYIVAYTHAQTAPIPPPSSSGVIYLKGDIKNRMEPTKNNCVLGDTAPNYVQVVGSSSIYSICPYGFMCPFYDSSNNYTYPAVCAPTYDCTLLRGYGSFCSTSMGMYEPQICSPGYYCPPPGNQTFPCPASFYCPYGSYAPIACELMSTCPAGSSYKQVLNLIRFDAI
jgi:hypothetical protein